jgi:phospholipid transport system substrate-binding protein
MVERLGDYDSQQVRVVSQRLSRDGRTGVVSTAIYNPEGYPARMDFRFYRSGKGWKVYDVMANGQSAVVHYRNQFRQSMYRSLTGSRSTAPYPAYPR